MTYQVVTDERTYNHIECVEHLIEVRRTWKDFTPTRMVFKWVGDVLVGWVQIDKEDMEVDYPLRHK